MAYLLEIPTLSDSRGDLSVIEEKLPYEIKRVFYIYNCEKKRGGHRHHKTIQALISLGGSSKIYISNEKEKKKIILDTPKKCLIVEPEDWHTMELENNRTFLLVLASERYDPKDYIEENYS